MFIKKNELLNNGFYLVIHTVGERKAKLLLLKIVTILVFSLLANKLINNFIRMFTNSSPLNFILLIINGIILYYSIQFCRKIYIKYYENYPQQIINKIKYLLRINNFYEVETQKSEVYNNKKKTTKIITEKIITNSMQIGVKVYKKEFIIRAFKTGDSFTDKVNNLDTSLSALFKLPINKKNDTVSYCDYYFDLIQDKRITISADMDEQKGTTIIVTEKISYDIAKVPHGLTVGGTGSGKSFYINSKILEYAKMGAKLYIADPKAADLSLLRFLNGFENDRVATEPNQIAKMLRLVNDVMENRYRECFNDVSAFGKTFIDFSLPPVVLVFDEYAAFVKSADKKVANECLNYLYNIILKGRAAGVFIELILQRPDASILDGAIRDQLGCRVALGEMSRQGYEMIFGSTEVNYQSISVKGGGYIKVDGLHNEPIYFETPFLDKNFDFLTELQKFIH